MATLNVTEFRGAGAVGAAVTQAPIMPSLGTQVVTFTTSVASNAFSDACGLIRVVASADCHVRVGVGALSATTSDMLLGAGEIEYFVIQSPGMKIAAIEA